MTDHPWLHLVPDMPGYPRRSNRVSLPDPPDHTQVIRVRVDLDGAKPKLWRRLELRGDLTMDRVHLVLQAAFGWYDGHLHRFWLGPDKRLWQGPYLLTDFDLDEGDEGVPERDVRLDQLLRAEGDRVFYTYDFGDEWNHTFKVEALRPAHPDDPPALCLTGRGAGPMEDIGGIHAHNDMVATEADGDQPPDPDLRTPPPGWQPDEFDVDQTNVAILMWLASPEDAIALAEEQWGAVTQDSPSALEDVLTRMPAALRGDLVTLVEELFDDDEAPASSDGKSDDDVAAVATRPWRLLLDLADDGIELTNAGWMRPHVVETLFTELNMDSFWIGKGNREDLTAPVHELRTLTQELRWLRKRKGRLLLTKRGRSARDDDALVWQGLVDHLVAVEEDAQRDAVVLYLLHAGAHNDTGPFLPGKVVRHMSALSWATSDGAPISADHVRSLVWPTMRLLRLVDNLAGAASPAAAREVVRALTRDALRA